jgi:hypothetical protein
MCLSSSTWPSSIEGLNWPGSLVSPAPPSPALRSGPRCKPACNSDQARGVVLPHVILLPATSSGMLPNPTFGSLPILVVNRKAEGQSDAGGVRSPCRSMSSADHAVAVQFCVRSFISQISRCTASRRHAFTRPTETGTCTCSSDTFAWWCQRVTCLRLSSAVTSGSCSTSSIRSLSTRSRASTESAASSWWVSRGRRSIWFNPDLTWVARRAPASRNLSVSFRKARPAAEGRIQPVWAALLPAPAARNPQQTTPQAGPRFEPAPPW